MYDLIQSALTATIQGIALAGFGGIAVHAMWKHHTSWMATYCPPVAPYTPDTQAEVEPQPEQPQQSEAAEDIWETPISSSPARYWVRQLMQPVEPVLMLMPAKEEQPKLRGRKPGQKNAPKTPACDPHYSQAQSSLITRPYSRR